MVKISKKLSKTKSQAGKAILQAVYDLIEQESPQTLEQIKNQLTQLSDPSAISTNEAELALELQEKDYTPQEKQRLNLTSLLQSYQQRRQLLENAITSEEAAQLLGCQSRQTPLDRLKSQTLIAVLDGGKWRYPLWQFDAEGPDGVIAGLPEVLKALQVSNLAKVSWLIRPNPVLDSLTPIEALQSGLTERTVAEARGVGAA